MRNVTCSAVGSELLCARYKAIRRVEEQSGLRVRMRCWRVRQVGVRNICDPQFIRPLLRNPEAGSGDLGTNRSTAVSSLHTRASPGTRDGLRCNTANFRRNLIDGKARPGKCDQLHLQGEWGISTSYRDVWYVICRANGLVEM